MSVLHRHSKIFHFVSSVKEEDDDSLEVGFKWGFVVIFGEYVGLRHLRHPSRQTASTKEVEAE